MKFKTNVIQDSILCIIMLLIYICLFYERSLFPSITLILKDVTLVLFIITSIFYCIYYAYKLNFIFLVINIAFYLPFVYIINFVKSSTKTGYALYELYRILFFHPLQSYKFFKLEYWIVLLAILTISASICKILVLKYKRHKKLKIKTIELR